MPLTKEFKSLRRSLFKSYIGKKVPSKYQDRYGKTYDKKEVISFSYALAKAKGIPVH